MWPLSVSYTHLVYCREMLNPEIYSQMEQLQYAQTPEFLVVVEK